MYECHMYECHILMYSKDLCFVNTCRCIQVYKRQFCQLSQCRLNTRGNGHADGRHAGESQAQFVPLGTDSHS